MNQHDFPDELHQVTTYNLPGVAHSFFTAPGATWIATLAEKDVRRVLDAKDPKYDRYRLQVDEVWLVISFNGALMSTWFQEVDSAHAWAIATKFDRVFLISHFESRVIGLTKRADPDSPEVS